MAAGRTLLRRQTKERVTLPDGQVVFADKAGRPHRTKPGTAFRRVTTIRKASPGWPYEWTFHATKGYRFQRVPA